MTITQSTAYSFLDLVSNRERALSQYAQQRWFGGYVLLSWLP
jgi:hypothetical protein